MPTRLGPDRVAPTSVPTEAPEPYHSAPPVLPHMGLLSPRFATTLGCFARLARLARCACWGGAWRSAARSPRSDPRRFPIESGGGKAGEQIEPPADNALPVPSPAFRKLAMCKNKSEIKAHKTASLLPAFGPIRAPFGRRSGRRWGTKTVLGLAQEVGRRASLVWRLTGRKDDFSFFRLCTYYTARRKCWDGFC